MASNGSSSGSKRTSNHIRIRSGSTATSSNSNSSSSSSNDCRRRHHERRLLKYTSEQLFEVVSNVDKYQEFVPWCKQSTILRNSKHAGSISSDSSSSTCSNELVQPEAPRELEAELVVGFGVFTERYVSKVSLEANKSVVAVSNQTNLFEHLRTEWKFLPASDPKSCWVTFQVDFHFKNALYNQVTLEQSARIT